VGVDGEFVDEFEAGDLALEGVQELAGKGEGAFFLG
jgi:hypothetical protein